MKKKTYNLPGPTVLRYVSEQLQRIIARHLLTERATRASSVFRATSWPRAEKGGTRHQILLNMGTNVALKTIRPYLSRTLLIRRDTGSSRSFKTCRHPSSVVTSYWANRGLYSHSQKIPKISRWLDGSLRYGLANSLVRSTNTQTHKDASRPHTYWQPCMVARVYHTEQPPRQQTSSNGIDKGCSVSLGLYGQDLTSPLVQEKSQSVTRSRAGPNVVANNRKRHLGRRQLHRK